MTRRDQDTSSPAVRARLEIGRTDVSRPLAWTLVVLVGLAVLVPPTVQLALDLAGGRGALSALAPLAHAARDLSPAGGLFAANRQLREAIEDTETRLEDESWLRHRLLPPTQRVLTGVLGLGNERVVLGQDGWWYLTDDVRHVTGSGFLEPGVVERRWKEEGITADPLPALTVLAADLARRDIELLVLPVPVKPTLVPAPLAGGEVHPPVHNASYAAFLAAASAAGLEVYDPTADLLAIEAAGDDSFLHTDTHWTPTAVEKVAAGIATHAEELGLTGGAELLLRRPVRVDGRGDLVNLLELPSGTDLIPPEAVETERVLTASGGSWRPDPSARILLLGDSFTNVFSDPALGWGAGAGLAEQLSHSLAAPVDVIARNAGGAELVRSELAAELEAGRDRLQGKKLVVYQFAARELSFGDWRPIALRGNL